MTLQIFFCVLLAFIWMAGWLIIAGAVALAEEQKNMSPGMATGMENAFPVPFRGFSSRTSSASKRAIAETRSIGWSRSFVGDSRGAAFCPSARSWRSGPA